MVNKKNWKVILCQRDKIILRDLFYSKGLDIETLIHRYFKGRHKTTVAKRLNRLYDGNYLTKGAHVGRSKNQIVYTILPKGFHEIQEILSGQVARREFKSSNIEHDLQLARIFDRLSSSRGLLEIKTENEIQSIIFGNNDLSYEPLRRLNTDIYFSLLIKEKEYKVAIEFERTQKESSRWADYLLNYHLEESIDVALYICNGQQILNGLKKIESELAIKYSGKIFFCTLHDFYLNKEIATFVNTNGKLFTMNFHSQDYLQPTSA